tara:strand:+ start:229 stop:417 length:189 start_codon:yes stop_codon:yes gene_type:complete
MSDLAVSTNSISPFAAILWCFYPVAFLVLVELVLRATDDDDDDFQGGKGVRVTQPIAVPTGA